jgi:hypothetical protein
MSSKAQNTSVLVKEPMQVIEVPDKKIIAVETEEEKQKRSEKAEESKEVDEENQNKPLETDMDVTMSEEIASNNET